MWEEAFMSPPHDTTSVFERAAEGFHPVQVAPPNMFAHEEEIRRLPSSHSIGAILTGLATMRAENEKAHAAIGERIGQVDKRLSEQIASMAEDVAKIPVIEAGVRQINQRPEERA